MKSEAAKRAFPARHLPSPRAFEPFPVFAMKPTHGQRLLQRWGSKQHPPAKGPRFRFWNGSVSSSMQAFAYPGWPPAPIRRPQPNRRSMETGPGPVTRRTNNPATNATGTCMPPPSAGANPLLISTMKIARSMHTTSGITTGMVRKPNAMKLPPTNIRSVTYEPIRRGNGSPHAPSTIAANFAGANWSSWAISVALIAIRRSKGTKGSRRRNGAEVQETLLKLPSKFAGPNVLSLHGEQGGTSGIDCQGIFRANGSVLTDATRRRVTARFVLHAGSQFRRVPVLYGAAAACSSEAVCPASPLPGR